MSKLRQIEVLTAGGKSIPVACKEAGITRCYPLPLAPAACSPRLLMLAQPEMVQ